MDPGQLRIAWTSQPTLGTTVHPECLASLESAVAVLSELGHELREDHPPVDGPDFSRAFLTVMAGELAADMVEAEHTLGRRPRRADVEPASWALVLLGRGLSSEAYAGAVRSMERTGRKVGAFFEACDVLLTPTVATPPPRIGELGPTPTQRFLLRALTSFGSGHLVRGAGLLDEAASRAFEFTPWTPIYNATGQPAMSVPLHWSAGGLPVGVHFVGKFGREDTLLRLAAQLEEARPWFDRLPPIARTVPSA